MTDSAKKQLMYVSLKAQLLIVQDIIETLQERKASLETKMQALAEDLKKQGNKLGEKPTGQVADVEKKRGGFAHKKDSLLRRNDCQ